MDLKDKIVVVTGGGFGIGEALCRRFAKEGAEAVVVADVNESDAARVAGSIAGGAAVKCDVSREEDMIRLIEFTEKTFGPIDFFCSNAGIMVRGSFEAPNESWQRIWEVNVMSHVYASRAVIPRMIERGGGAFMVTASAAGLLNQIGAMAYAVSKHAAVGLAESLSIAYGDRGIKVFALCPQAVRTAMTGPTLSTAAVDGLMEPDRLAEAVMQGIAGEEFLILPHPEVRTYYQRKASDIDRWLAGMRRLQSRARSGAALKVKKD
jgi:NAD(P)-dependent dehydrogenase (short-subunit alcohol dehydrogenase family)